MPSMLIMLVVMGGMIWFMQRQQKKQAETRQNQLNAIQKGDEIITIGGMYAIVDEVDVAAKKIVLDVDGVYLTFELSAIKTVVTKANQAVTTVAEEVVEVQEDASVEADDSSDSAIEEN